MCPSWCFPCFLLGWSLQVVFSSLYMFPIHITLTEFVFSVCEVTCRWSQALATLWQCSPQTKTARFSLLKTEFLSRFCVILCLTIDSIVIGQFDNSFCTSAIRDHGALHFLYTHQRYNLFCPTRETKKNKLN